MSQQVQTIPCPECQTPMPISVQHLLTGQAIACLHPQCGVVLKIDQQKSANALAKVEKLQEAVDRFHAATQS